MIEVRKRNRATELKYDHASVVVGHDPRGEFAKSVLLGKLSTLSEPSHLPFANENQSYSLNEQYTGANGHSDYAAARGGSSDAGGQAGEQSMDVNVLQVCGLKEDFLWVIGI